MTASSKAKIAVNVHILRELLVDGLEAMSILLLRVETTRGPAPLLWFNFMMATEILSEPPREFAISINT